MNVSRQKSTFPDICNFWNSVVLNVMFVLGSCSPWWLLDFTAKLLQDVLELFPGAPNTTEADYGYLQNFPYYPGWLSLYLCVTIQPGYRITY